MNLVKVGYKKIQLHETPDKTVYSMAYWFGYWNCASSNAQPTGYGPLETAVSHLFTPQSSPYYW